MSDTKLTNLPSMAVGKAVEKLSYAYSAVIKNGLPIKTMPSVMLWGPPGVGKSQAIRQIAKKIEYGTGKSVKVTDVRLLLFNPIDLRGIPTSNADKTLAIWLKPQIFQMDSSDNIINILFLDEISAAPQSVQAAAYQITLDRVVGEHRLPDNCIVIAAGNRTTDKSVAYKMPKALANRLMHIEIEGDFDSWNGACNSFTDSNKTKLRSDGSFIWHCVNVPGSLTALNERDKKLFDYNCYIEVHKFWSGFEDIRDMNHEKWPMLIDAGGMNEYAGFQELIVKSKALGKQMVIMN